ncbi:hypothetical protein H5395_06675 [Paracoccus sp. MC1854]|uniref:hypothetical protein n=1 Tax=Paracoccus sp. MC1854 TaxID=2760306 RepID=UPI00160288B1|nr:hypothetical protein [Paracoccus sp. MC1854]MBB1491221.1 hypothetical protein [Paracoccus sp. MC1854]
MESVGVRIGVPADQRRRRLLAFPAEPLRQGDGASQNHAKHADLLKTIRKIISLSVFGVLSWLYLDDNPARQHGAGFSLICSGAWIVLHGRYSISAQDGDADGMGRDRRSFHERVPAVAAGDGAVFRR